MNSSRSGVRTAKLLLRPGLRRATRSKLRPFVKLATTIRGHLPETDNMLKAVLSNARIGANNTHPRVLRGRPEFRTGRRHGLVVVRA